MKKNTTLIPIPITGGLNSEPSSAKLLNDGEWFSLINCRPYQGDLVRRYGDKLLGDALASLSPLGLFFFNNNGTDTLYLMTSDGKIKWLAAPYATTQSWADVQTGLSTTMPWTACKFTNAPNNTTYILFSNNSDDIITREGTNTSNLTKVSSTTLVVIGDATSQYDITNTAGNTYRYTWDGTGTDPVMATILVGYLVTVSGLGNGNDVTLATVTGIGTNYFEITNTAGVGADLNNTGVVLSYGAPATHRPTKAKCIANFGNMLIAANCTALKPLKCEGDTKNQISSIELSGFTVGTNLYWELDYDAVSQQPNTAPVTPISGQFKDTLKFELAGVTSINAPSGSCFYRISCPVTVAGSTGTVTCNIYSDSARTVLVATGTTTGTYSSWSGNGGWDYDYTMQPFTIPFSAAKSYTHLGDLTTRIDVTVNGGTTRYTYDGTGTDPSFGSRHVGDVVTISGFGSANDLSTATVITNVSSTYIEVTHAGVGATDKTNLIINCATPGMSGVATLTAPAIYSCNAWTTEGELRVSDSPEYDRSYVATFSLYTYAAPNFTKVSTGLYTAVQSLAGSSVKIALSPYGSSSISGVVEAIVVDNTALVNLSRKIEIAYETDTNLVRWCDPNDLTRWQQLSYEKLPPGGAGGILGTKIVNGVLYFLYENTIHRAMLTGSSEFPLKFEYDVCPSGCPNPDAATEFGGNLVFMAKDKTWKSFDGFAVKTLSDSVLTKLNGFAPISVALDSRLGILYLNAGASSSEEKLLGCVMSNPIRFFEELHPYHMKYLCSGIDQVYATNLNGTTLSVVAMNELTKTTVDLTATQIAYECLTKEYMFGDRMEGHVLHCTIYGDSNSSAVTITPYIDGVALTAQDITLSASGTDFEINRWAKSLQLKIASKSGAASTTFKVYKITAEIHNTRKK